MNFKQSDGGREATGFGTEKNDCTVTALANAASIPYKEAHEIFRQVGRRNRKGCNLTTIGFALNRLKNEGKLDYEQKVVVKSAYRDWRGRVKRSGTTVAMFLYSLPKTGRFYLCSTTHAFAYVDGVLVDSNHRPMSRGIMQFCAEIKPVDTKPTDVKPTQPQINELWERLNKLEGK